MTNEELNSMLVEADEHNTSLRFPHAEELATLVLTQLASRRGEDASIEDSVIKSRALLSLKRASGIRVDRPMAIAQAEVALVLAELWTEATSQAGQWELLDMSAASPASTRSQSTPIRKPLHWMKSVGICQLLQ